MGKSFSGVKTMSKVFEESTEVIIWRQMLTVSASCFGPALILSFC